MFWKRLAFYLNPLTPVQKPDPDLSLRFMGINRISVFVFPDLHQGNDVAGV
ncbi:MAG: hypothetical protein IPN85_14500 [Flavobacteriales bacterium]|nr:hypothetical protein [Flavobacteriales bacterium]